SSIVIHTPLARRCSRREAASARRHERPRRRDGSLTRTRPKSPGPAGFADGTRVAPPTVARRVGRAVAAAARWRATTGRPPEGRAGGGGGGRRGAVMHAVALGGAPGRGLGGMGAGAGGLGIGRVGPQPAAVTTVSTQGHDGVLEPMDPFIANLSDEDGRRYVK